ncbi:MAG TPA: LD-carboxypeptidase [Flavisolibacter sp.]|jgi:muramoyltetrapeptide carboxypeptidase|nr:LD-carboxypeptidase [Flavisolibacter sp.]
MIEIPPYLKKGDTIGIVAPAGFMPIERMQACIETLDSWGYTIRLGATTHSDSLNYFSGTDEERRADLQAMLDDRDIKAILCARGGYGMSRIIDDLNFKKFRKHPKWIIGFSDITVLHAHIYNRFKIASLHAPMASAFNDQESINKPIGVLHKIMEGDKLSYEWDTHELNREGEVNGQLVGGNLTILAHLIGTKSDFKTKNHILFLEDTGEYLYNIDRMLLQLRRNGKLDKIAGLVIGGFTEIKDTERPFGKSVYEIIYDQVKEFDYPLCFGIPVSHGKENLPMKIGVSCNLKVQNNSVTLEELPEE